MLSPKRPKATSQADVLANFSSATLPSTVRRPSRSNMHIPNKNLDTRGFVYADYRICNQSYLQWKTGIGFCALLALLTHSR